MMGGYTNTVECSGEKLWVVKTYDGDINQRKEQYVKEKRMWLCGNLRNGVD